MKIIEPNKAKIDQEATERRARELREEAKRGAIKEAVSFPGFKFIIEMLDNEIEQASDLTTLPNVSLEELGKAVLISKEVVLRLKRFRGKLIEEM